MHLQVNTGGTILFAYNDAKLSLFEWDVGELEN